MVDVAGIESLARAGVERLAGIVQALNDTPAFGATGDGYEKTIELLAEGLRLTGLEPEIIQVPRDYLDREWGEDLERTRDYIPVRRYADRAIVLARIPGSDSDAPNVHLTQHYDLPGYYASEDAWQSDATGAWIRSRGANQCRSGLVSLLVAASTVAAGPTPPAGDVYVSFTPDNHLGGETGAGYLVHEGIGRSPFVITGGASGTTGMILGYKGAGWIRLTVRGKAGLASQPHLAINAIDKMRSVQNGLAELGKRLAGRPSSWPTYPNAMSVPTLTAARIDSSGAGIPEMCVLYIDRRTTPEETLAEAIAEIEAVLEAARLVDSELVVKLDVVHAVESTSLLAHERLPAALAQSIRSVVRSEPESFVLPYYTEQRVFSAGWHAQVVGYGPGKSDAVPDDDRVLLEDIARAAAVIALTARAISAERG